MGCYDSVWVTCPGCGKECELQSKADECLLRSYTLRDDIPESILDDLTHETYYCQKCRMPFLFGMVPRDGWRGLVYAKP